MDVIPVLMAFSFALVIGAILMFVWSTKQGDHDHADRLCLLPLEDDEPASSDQPDADVSCQQKSDVS